MMRRISVWFVLPTVLLALSLGTLLGRALKDDSTPAAAGKPKVLGVQITQPPDSTTTSSSEAKTTTTAASPGTTTATTAKAATTATTARATTAAATATTTTRVSGDPNCGTGSAAASADLAVDGTGPPTDPTFTYTGPVRVDNKTTKAIQIDTLVLRLTSDDGTVESVAVPGAAGSVIQPGATQTYSFKYASKHPPKQNGASIGEFTYRAPGGSKPCAAA
jgi:uncharacterized protein affecting Mg2+/Co2+ transport